MPETGFIILAATAGACSFKEADPARFRRIVLAVLGGLAVITLIKELAAF